ncbi:MAG: hypothetical protein IJX51_08320 [Clostridia bacterium]|nr:hypothetical protein [Clostridia bacterium]
MNRYLINLPYQNKFLVVTNTENIYKGLILKYGKYATIYTREEAPDNTIEAYTNENSYIVKYKNEIHYVTSAVQAIIELIGKDRKYDESVYAMHGAAIEKDGQAYLFLAPTGTGKTTLTAYLTLKGFGYITDDCILVSKADLTVFPCSTPIQMRSGGVEVLQSDIPDFNIELKQVSDRYALFPNRYVERTLPIKEIFFIKRTDINEIRELSSMEKNQLLLKSSLTEHKLNVEILRFISKLSKVKCSELKYKDLEYVLRVINNEL